LFDLIGGLDHQVDAQVQTRMRLEVRTLVERATRWLVNERWHADAEGTVDRVGTELQKVVRALPDTLAGRDLDRLEQRAGDLRDHGVPAELAHRIAALPPAYSALAIVEVSQARDSDPLEVARLHSAVGQRLDIDLLYDRVVALPRTDRWQTMARAALRDDLQHVHAGLTGKVLDAVGDDEVEGADEIEARIDAWIMQEGVVFDRALATLTEICRDDAADLARLSVALRVARTLLG